MGPDWLLCWGLCMCTMSCMYRPACTNSSTRKNNRVRFIIKLNESNRSVNLINLFLLSIYITEKSFLNNNYDVIIRLRLRSIINHLSMSLSSLAFILVGLVRDQLQKKGSIIIIRLQADNSKEVSWIDQNRTDQIRTDVAASASIRRDHSRAVLCLLHGNSGVHFASGLQPCGGAGERPWGG